MSTVRERAVENIDGIVTLLILGAGFVGMFAGIHNWWLIWVIGFAVFLPLVAILSGDDEDEVSGERESHHQPERSDDETTDALSKLRDRYARGELTDEQFERKLDALLETEHPENAAEWRSREREQLEEQS